MLTKAKRLLLFILACAAQQVFAQNLSRSPYSALGLGDMQFTGSAWMSAMGQVSQGISSPFLINNQNPASYHALQLTTFDVAARGSLINLKTSTSSSTTNTGTYGYFALAFPLSQKLKWGASFGLMPYTGVGYNISRNVSQAGITATENITGTGGLSRFYIGSGIRVYKGLSAGVNASYLYGQSNNTMFLNISRQDTMFNLAEFRNRYIGDFQFDIGLQFTDTFVRKQDKYKWTAGVTLSPQVQLSAYDNYSVRTMPIGSSSASSGGGIGKDTVVDRSNVKGTVTLPMMIKGGVHFQKLDAWGVGIDLGYYNWENYRAFGLRDSLKNTLSVGIGASIIPNAYAIKNYVKRVEYRAGFRYDNGNLKVNDQNINTYAISAGLGLPLGQAKSRLNISAEYMVRGTTANRLVREEYFSFTIGLIICDKWFHQYRYD